MPTRRHTQVNGTATLTLFDDQHRQAISDMIEQFRRQLKDARTDPERAELELAIQSWTAAMNEPLPCNAHGSKRSTTSSNSDDEHI